VIAHNRVKGSYRSRPFWAMLGCRIENNYLDRAAGLTNPAGGAVIGFRHGRGGRLWGNRCADAVDVAVNDGSAAEPHNIRAICGHLAKHSRCTILATSSSPKALRRR
jgi:hypothetical protein